MKCGLGMDVGTLGCGIMGIECLLGLPMDVMVILGESCLRKKR